MKFSRIALIFFVLVSLDQLSRFFIIIQDAYFLSKSKIYNKGKKVKEGFEYSSKNNPNFLNSKQIKKFLKKAKIKN